MADTTLIEKLEPEDIHLVTRYICTKCHAVWAGPANYCPGCGRKVEGVKEFYVDNDTK